MKKTATISLAEALAGKQFLTPLEIEQLGIASRSRQKKCRMKGEGFVPFIYVGNRIRYVTADVLAWVEENRVTRALQVPDGDRRKASMSAEARAKRAAERAAQTSGEQNAGA